MKEKTMIEGARRQAQPYLEGKFVKRALIGITMVLVELSDGSVGSSYVLREELSGCTSIFKDNLSLLGMPAQEMADWALNQKHVLKRALAIATINCGARAYLEEKGLVGNVDMVDLVKEGERVAMVGYIGPVVRALSKKGVQVDVFDKGHAAYQEVKPLEALKSSLESADVVYLSGTTFINNSIDELVSYCKSARELVIIGSTTIGFPEAYRDSPVTLVGGTLWRQEKKDDLFLIAGLAGGIKNLSACIEKYAYRPDFS